MFAYSLWRIACHLLVCSMLGACATRHVDLSQIEYIAPQPPPPVKSKGVTKPPPPKGPPSLVVRERVITEEEIRKLVDKDPKLTIYVCQEILSRLNRKARLYIVDDIKKKRPLKVPVDFAAYRNWSPLPKILPGGVDVPKLILVVKDIPFTGWYENGRMKGDALTCVGKQWKWTESGIYKVLDKAPDKHSNLYQDAFGEPAWMPFALRIYSAVWLHAGDVVGPYCSHGCINLPPESAEKLYDWATVGTPVMITDSLSSMSRDLSKLYSPERKERPLYGPLRD